MKKLIYFLTIVYFAYTASLAILSYPEAPTKIYHGKIFPYLADKPLSEDGYYMLTVARNFAEGEGFEYNNGRRTTGVQPLATIIYGVVFYFGKTVGLSNTSVLRLIIFLSAVLLFSLGLLLFKICKEWFPLFDKNLLLLLSLIFSILNFELLVQFSNGLETGMYAFFVLFSIYKSLKFIEQTGSRKGFFDFFFLGSLFGIAALGRLDFIILSTVFGILAVGTKRITFYQAVGIYVTQLFFLIPWFIYIYNATGSLFQSSITAQTSWISWPNFGERLFYIITAFLEHATPLIFTMHRTIALIFVFILVIAGIYFTKKNLSPEHFLPEKLRFVFIYWGIPFLVFFIVYFVYSSATYFYLRYTIPFALLLLPFFIYHAYNLLNKLTKPYLYSFAVVSLVIFFLQAGLYFHSGKLGVHQSLRVNYIKTNFSLNERIGVYQSGVTGFYCTDVFNLDGKIDNLVTKYRGEDNLERFLDSVGINVLMEWREAFPFGKGNYFVKNWELKTNNIGDGMTACYIRKDVKSK